MVLFILFPGGNTSPKDWDQGESKLLSNLKTIGDVYIYENKFNNACYYNKEKINHDEYPSDIDFEMDYLDPETHCEIIYNELKQQSYTEFIPVAWSAGAILALTFCKKYVKDCVLCILLDCIPITGDFLKFRLDTLDNTKFAKNINNKKLKGLQKKIKSDRLKDDTRKLIDIEHYAFANYAIKNLSAKLLVPTLSFIDLEFPDKYENTKDFNNLAKIQECETFKRENGDIYNYRYFVNKGHDFFRNKECNDEIITCITNFLQKQNINMKGGYYYKYQKYKIKYMQIIH